MVFFRLCLAKPHCTVIPLPAPPFPQPRNTTQGTILALPAPRDPIPERSHNKNGHGEIFGPLGNNEFKLKLRSELVSPPLSPPPPAQSYNLAFYPL